MSAKMPRKPLPIYVYALITVAAVLLVVYSVAELRDDSTKPLTYVYIVLGVGIGIKAVREAVIVSAFRRRAAVVEEPVDD